MTLDILQEIDEKDGTTGHREEASNKNPIRIRMNRDHLTLPLDRITRTIAIGRDFFHTFISATVGRHYQRPPIYLVDGWLIKALGVFTTGRFSPPPETQIRKPHKSSEYMWLTKPIRGFGPTIRLFNRLQEVQELLNGIRILSLDRIAGQLEETCEKLLELKATPDEVANLVNQLVNLVEGAEACIQRDLYLQPYVNKDFIAKIKDALSRLKEAAVLFTRPKLPEGLGSFEGDRPSGVLYGSIPELDIQGPAILIAPRRIQQWIEKWNEFSDYIMDIPPNFIEYWFGVIGPQHRLFAVALQNVLHHEMTHAMVALPTDAVEDVQELFIGRYKFYLSNRGFEEGLCNATAAVVTGMVLQKAMFGIKGKFLPKLHQGRYAEDWDRNLLPWLRHTYTDYYGDETDTFINAWKSHKKDYGAFAGMLKLYSTNFTGFNWKYTQEAFQNGIILTSR